MAQVYPHLHFVILAEDYGVRLWPIAREQSPACFAPADPGSSESLLSATVARTRPFTDAPLTIVTTEGLAALMYGELASHSGLSLADFELLTLPEEHGSTFAVAVAAARIRHDDPEAVIAVLRADQHMSPDERWEHVLYHAYLLALRGSLAVIGAEQQEKSAGLCYIRPGRPVEGADNAFEVKQFVTGVQLATARRAKAAGAYWYAGIFVARATVLLRAVEQADDRQETAEHLGVGRIAEAAAFFALFDRETLLKEDARAIIDSLPREDIEPAVLSAAEGLVVLPTSIVFETLGSLEDLDALTEPDEAGNHLIGNALVVDGARTTVLGQEPNRSITAFGLDDALVVDTPDALFIANKSRLRDLGAVFEALREAKVPQLSHSARRPFPWGSATLLASDDTSATWQLRLRQGMRLDAQTIPARYGAGGVGTQVPREQYVVTGGSVEIAERPEAAGADSSAGSTTGSGAGAAEPVRMDSGDAFESDPEAPLCISCAGDGPATLVLTAVWENHSLDN